MGELIRNAWLGWLNYTDKGKAAALFLAVLLFLWLGKYREHKRLLVYTTCMAVICIFPPTAAILMLYQTRFYDYQWIWSMVPVTLMIAWGGVIFLTGIWENYRKRGIFKPVCITLFVLALLWLCGNMGNQEWQPEQTRQPQIERVLEAVLRGEDSGGTEGNGDSQDICLLAPREIVETVRAYSGKIGLLYGRNMWDAALNAYSYDVYDSDVQEIYQWMCRLEEGGNEQLVSGNEEAGNEQLMGGSNQEAANEQSMNSNGEAESQEILQKALDRGVNRILLPESADRETISAIERILDVQAQKLDGYYLICIN